MFVSKYQLKLLGRLLDIAFKESSQTLDVFRDRIYKDESSSSLSKRDYAKTKREDSHFRTSHAIGPRTIDGHILLISECCGSTAWRSHQ